jgi:phosphate starvation-inducible PhoH-like protein
VPTFGPGLPTVIRRHTLSGADNRRLAHLCGPLDEHLRRIESTLGVVLTRRQHQFRIDGPRAAVDRAIAVLDLLYANGPGAHQRTDAGPAAQGRAAAPRAPAAAAGPVDAEAPGGAAHAPCRADRPHAQPAEVPAPDAGHDITFGIGPAGTGKTFLAVACAVDALERRACSASC